MTFTIPLDVLLIVILSVSYILLGILAAGFTKAGTDSNIKWDTIDTLTCIVGWPILAICGISYSVWLLFKNLWSNPFRCEK